MGKRRSQTKVEESAVESGVEVGEMNIEESVDNSFVIDDAKNDDNINIGEINEEFVDNNDIQDAAITNDEEVGILVEEVNDSEKTKEIGADSEKSVVSESVTEESEVVVEEMSIEENIELKTIVIPIPETLFDRFFAIFAKDGYFIEKENGKVVVKTADVDGVKKIFQKCGFKLPE